MLKWGRLGRRDLRALRTVLFAGEVYPTDELRALQGALPNVALYNLYGPTETNVCTYWKVPPLDSSRDAAIPIGFDCESCQGVVVDDELRVVGDDTEGELLVRGGTLMSGYWGDLQRTKAALIPDFLYPHLGDYFYRTGDIVRRRLDGSYTFLGRRDHQVKVRGYRVELGEVEVALRRIDSLADAAVVAVERQGGQETELVAFTVACGDFAHDPDEATLQLERRLAAFLPKYMIPSEIRWVRNLPTTSTGKVDREALSTIARGGVGDATASQAAHSDIMQPSRW
jgi:acyl-coenzyme A synthetase/AMP-(fatty) acid ligase